MKNNSYQKTYSDFYTDDASIHLSDEGTRVIQAHLRDIKFSSKKKVLDVACGVSTFGKIFSDQLFGIDINREAVRFVKKNGIQAKLGDVEKKWEYPNEYFDIVIASHIIEHVVNPDKFILEARRVLKKGGLLIVVTPNLATWFNRILLLLGIQPFFTEVSTVDKTLGMKFTRKLTSIRSPLGHLRIFTLGSLVDILELHGFNIYKISGVEFVIFPTPLRFIDKFVSYIPSLASTIIVVGRKE